MIQPDGVEDKLEASAMDEAREPGTLFNSGDFDGLANRSQAGDRRASRGARLRRRHDQLPPARLGDLAPALLGRPSR